MTSGVADQETIKYLGFPIVVNGTELTIYTPDGRLIFTGRMAVASARKVIRGYRKSVFTLHRITLAESEKTSGLTRFVCLGCHTLRTLPVVNGTVTCLCGERYRAESE